MRLTFFFGVRILNFGIGGGVRKYEYLFRFGYFGGYIFGVTKKLAIFMDFI